MKKKNEKAENKNRMKIIKISTIILLIVLVTMIGFFGIYSQNRNQISNNVKGYSYAMDINGARNIKLQVNSETTQIIKDSQGNIIEEATDEEIKQNGYTKEEVPNNSQDVKTEENYKKSKEIISERLKKLGVQYYNISLNEKTGEMTIEIPEDQNTDTVLSNFAKVGKFEIIDSETKEVLLNNSNIKSSSALYNTSTSGTTVYLEIAFNKEGKKKLEEISKTYVKIENNTTENNLEAGNATESTSNVVEETSSDEVKTEEKKVTMKIDDEEIMTTNFDEIITTGKIQLSVGTASTDTKTIQDYIAQAQNIATSLDKGNLPIKYDIIKNQYVLSDITEQHLLYIALAIIGFVIIGIIILIIRFKINGLLAGFAYIGLFALYTLLIRYANVVISIESIFGIITMLILNYIFTNMLLKNINENKEDIVDKSVIKTYTKFFNRIIPICIMVIAFCFVKWIPMSSFGMISFWGLTLIAVYNAVITRCLLKINIESK